MVKSVYVKWAIILGIVVAAYFVQVEVNVYLGKKALAKTGLEVRDLEQAFAFAKKESKPILADLSAIWCPSCRKLDNQVLADPTVKAAIQEKYIYARVEYETEEGKAFQKRYGVSGFPNLLILDNEGNLVRKLQVVFKPEAFIEQL